MKQTPAERAAKAKPKKQFKTARGVGFAFEPPAILKLRTELGLTTRDVAEGSGVNASQICRAEHGMDLLLSTALKLAQFFGQSVETIWPRPSKGDFRP